MAQALYAGLVSDTGNFRHSNSTPKIHIAAADLIAQGVHPARTFNALYQTATPSKLKLFGRAMGGLQLKDDGRFAYVSVTKADLAACGASHEDLDRTGRRTPQVEGRRGRGPLFRDRRWPGQSQPAFPGAGGRERRSAANSVAADTAWPPEPRSPNPWRPSSPKWKLAIMDQIRLDIV